MSLITFPEFTQTCQANGIGLDPDFLAQPRVPRASYQPDEWYEAVAAAGDRLRQTPGLALADAAVPEHLIGDTPTVPQTSLRHVLNASRQPIAGASGRTFTSEEAPWTLNCSDSEGGFADTFQAMAAAVRGEKSGRQEVGWSIVTDREVPIGVTKMIGERLTVSLADLVVNGIPYPSGSLFSVSADRKIRNSERERLVVPGEALATIGFMRLSAYALPLKIRSVFSAGREVGRNNTPERWPLDRMRTVAQQAIGHSTAI